MVTKEQRLYYKLSKMIRNYKFYAIVKNLPGIFGSTRSLYSASKSPLAHLEYTPYGEIHTNLGITTQADITPTYTGKPYDHETGLYYFPYRYYNPQNARWLKRDPLGMIDGPNVYAYVKGNPVSYMDPFGLKKEECPKSPCQKKGGQRRCGQCCGHIHKNAIKRRGGKSSVKLDATRKCCRTLCNTLGNWEAEGGRGRLYWHCCAATADPKEAEKCIDSNKK